MLRYGVPETALPRSVLAAEVAVMRQLGIAFRPNTRVGSDLPLAELCQTFDAVVLAIGAADADACQALGVTPSSRGVDVESATLRTSVARVFAAGDAVRVRKMAVASVGSGKTAAVSVHQLLSGAPVTGPGKPFNSQLGRLREHEGALMLQGCSAAPRVEPSTELGSGFAEAEARREAERCLHCDCRKSSACGLRRCAADYSARQQRYKPATRKDLEQVRQHVAVIYEPGKCIRCGRCVQITARAREPLGLAFVGRGFDVRVAVPFAEPLSEALTTVAAECVNACPTAALAFCADN